MGRPAYDSTLGWHGTWESLRDARPIFVLKVEILEKIPILGRIVVSIFGIDERTME